MELCSAVFQVVALYAVSVTCSTFGVCATRQPLRAVATVCIYKQSDFGYY